MNTGTKWLVYLQDLTELAYFRGDIRKCSYDVSWIDENGELLSKDTKIELEKVYRYKFVPNKLKERNARASLFQYYSAVTLSWNSPSPVIAK